MPDDPDVMLARIEELLGTGKHDWARRTLEGIYSTIAETGRVTLHQQEMGPRHSETTKGGATWVKHETRLVSIWRRRS